MRHRDSLWIQDDLILLQRDGHSRLVIPKVLQGHVLNLLHQGHWGITRMKQMARRYVWWPCINKDIENMVRACDPFRCEAAAPDPEYVSRPRPRKPWERLHLDHAGPFLGKVWLVCVDSHSKFPYVAMLSRGQTTSRDTVGALKQIFPIEGLPETVVSGNGPQFTSKEFEKVCEERGIVHLTSLAFHPASSGEAERFVQTFKRGLKKNCAAGKEVLEAFRIVLASYHSTPHAALESGPWEPPPAPPGRGGGPSHV